MPATNTRIRIRHRLLSVWGSPYEGYTFDGRGFLVSGVQSSRPFKRGEDNRVFLYEMRKGRSLHRHCTQLEGGKAEEFIVGAYQKTRSFVASGKFTYDADTPGDHARPWLDIIAAVDPLDLSASARRFRQIYGDIGILPPNMYRALVLQINAGCPYNRCTFCSFYKGQRYRAQTINGFHHHLSEVIGFFGPGLTKFQEVFLGSGSALAASDTLITGSLRLIQKELLQRSDLNLSDGGVHTFMDVVITPERPGSAYGEFRELGLTTVYIGVESGSEAVLRQLRKPQDLDKTRAIIHTLKEAGLAVGLIFLVGAGGKQLASEHEKGTVRFLEGLPLGRNDSIFLSRLSLNYAPAYGELAQREGTTLLSEDDIQAQYMRLFRQVRRPDVLVTGYDVEGFLY